MRVFISQPMLNKSNEEIEKRRAEIAELIKNEYPLDKIKVVGFFKNCRHNKNPLWFLAKALKVMSTCDIVVFSKGYQLARGCSIEHDCAIKYGLNIEYEEILKRKHGD